MLSILLEATKEADKKDIGAVLRELNILQRREENIKDFRTQLVKVINRIRKDKNIYIMVDNLDICHPKFIVDFLESIKYMLDIEGSSLSFLSVEIRLMYIKLLAQYLDQILT